ncbi:MAG: hypothetical protein BMS9Abin05_2032 [Rhodothermia bacterium]|nr:MAG: hypothetical protein BMS9Abin05_2032 [Rhodothermia bacterium]
MGPPRVVPKTTVMSTIRSRRRWIRVLLVLLTSLIVVLIFPSVPPTVQRVVTKTPIVQKSRALIKVAYIRRRIEKGDTSASSELAWLYNSDRGYHRYIVGDPAEILQPMIDEGDLVAIRSLALLLRQSNPDRANTLFLRAADLGDYSSQQVYLRETGFDISNTSAYLRRLHELQKDRPGWKISFNRAFKTLQDQADQGNSEAQQILDELKTIASESST